MVAQMSVLGLKLSSYPYLRSAMVRFPVITKVFVEQPLASPGSAKKYSKSKILLKKSRIRETPTLSTDADKSTNTKGNRTIADLRYG